MLSWITIKKSAPEVTVVEESIQEELREGKCPGKSSANISVRI